MTKSDALKGAYKRFAEARNAKANAQIAIDTEKRVVLDLLIDMGAYHVLSVKWDSVLRMLSDDD